jgi:chromosome segregation ATPase
MQYAPRTLGLADFIGLFKHQPFLEEMELIRQDWERPLMVKREEGSTFETSFSQNYAVWRNEELFEERGFSIPKHPESAIEQPKRKRTDIEEELRKQLEQCRIDLSKSKGQLRLLENQLEEENTMRVYLNQQLEKQDKQLTSLKEWQKRAEVAEEIAKGVQAELKKRMTEYDELVKKNGLAEKELAKVKRSTKGKMNVDKEVMDSLKKGKSILSKKIEVEKEKNRLAQLDIEEERRIRAQYMVQLEEERSARKAAESDMRDYQKRAESSKGRMMTLQSEIEIQVEELRELRSHYFEMEEELSKAKQERQECQGYMDSFTVQINSKIAELDIEKEELQRVRDKLARSDDMVRVLERSNEALGASNEVIIADNTVFHDKIRHITKQVEQAARYAERLQRQATQVGNDASKYREYMAAITCFIGDLANRGNAF